MNAHEMAMKTYEALQKRKKKKEWQKKKDLNGLGWNGVNKSIVRRNKKYYNG